MKSGFRGILGKKTLLDRVKGEELNTVSIGDCLKRILIQSRELGSNWRGTRVQGVFFCKVYITACLKADGNGY